MSHPEFTTSATFVKVEESLGLIMGYAIVCKQDGEEYYDLQGDHIPEDAMLKAAADFMLDCRVAGEMHQRDADGKVIKAGSVVFCWPMTSDIAKALGITVEKTGLLVAIRPDDPEALAKAKRGEYRGFSIGGKRIKDEPVA
jgi:hypothetical protein